MSEGLEGGGQPYQARHESAEESVPEQTGDVLPVTTSEDGVLAGIDSGHDDSPQREGRPSRLAAQVAATLISLQLDTPNYRPPKRKHVPEASDASSSALTTTSDAASSSPSPNDNSQDNQLHLPGSDRGCIPTSQATASLSRPGSASGPAPSTHEGRPLSSDVLPSEFADLKEGLRARGLMIGNNETVKHLWHIFNYMRTTRPSQTGSAGLDSFVESSPTSDERIRVLGTCITREEQNQGGLRLAKSLSVLRKRLCLVELIDNYLVEHEAWETWKKEPRSKRRKTEGPRCPLDRYTDILFPETRGSEDARPGDT